MRRKSETLFYPYLQVVLSKIIRLESHFVQYLLYNWLNASP